MRANHSSAPLAEAPRWYRQVGGLLLDAEGGVGMGANLGDAIWWNLIVMVLWALPLGVLGAAAGSVPARRRRPATGEGGTRSSGRAGEGPPPGRSFATR